MLFYEFVQPFLVEGSPIQSSSGASVVAMSKSHFNSSVGIIWSLLVARKSFTESEVTLIVDVSMRLYFK